MKNSILRPLGIAAAGGYTFHAVYKKGNNFLKENDFYFKFPNSEIKEKDFNWIFLMKFQIGPSQDDCSRPMDPWPRIEVRISIIRLAVRKIIHQRSYQLNKQKS